MNISLSHIPSIFDNKVAFLSSVSLCRSSSISFCLLRSSIFVWSSLESAGFSLVDSDFERQAIQINRKGGCDWGCVKTQFILFRERVQGEGCSFTNKPTFFGGMYSSLSHIRLSLSANNKWFSQINVPVWENC